MTRLILKAGIWRLLKLPPVLPNISNQDPVLQMKDPAHFSVSMVPSTHTSCQHDSLVALFNQYLSSTHKVLNIEQCFLKEWGWQGKQKPSTSPTRVLKWIKSKAGEIACGYILRSSNCVWQFDTLQRKSLPHHAASSHCKLELFASSLQWHEIPSSLFAWISRISIGTSCFVHGHT